MKYIICLYKNHKILLMSIMYEKSLYHKKVWQFLEGLPEGPINTRFFGRLLGTRAWPRGRFFKHVGEVLSRLPRDQVLNIF